VMELQVICDKQFAVMICVYRPIKYFKIEVSF